MADIAPAPLELPVEGRVWLDLDGKGFIYAFIVTDGVIKDVKLIGSNRGDADHTKLRHYKFLLSHFQWVNWKMFGAQVYAVSMRLP